MKNPHRESEKNKNHISGGIHMYQALDTIKIETGNQTVQEIADEICAL